MPPCRLARSTSGFLTARATAILVALAPASAPAVSTHSTAIDITPDGQEVWVVNPDHGSVSVIQATGPDANTLLAEIPVGREPWCLDIHPTNGEVWVTSYRDDRVLIVDAATRTVVDSVDTGYETFGVAFDPTGTTALVTASGSDEVYEIDVASRTVTRTLSVYRRPRGIAWRPDGARAWVSHLLTPGYFGRLTVVDTGPWTASEILVQQVFGVDRAGYPSAMQNITLAPAPGDSVLWIPTILINSAKGAISGHPLTPTNIFHACIRPIIVTTGTDLNWDTYFMSEGGTPSLGYPGGTTPVGGPVAVDFKAGQAYVANFHSNDVTVLDDDILAPTEILVFPAGKAPIGIVTHPTIHRAYVANWLSRDVTVFNTSSDAVIATVPTTTSEVLPLQVLHGKQLFFTSTGKMSLDNRNSCGSCHVFGRPDARNWDLTQFGKHVRASRDWRGAGFTGPYGWTSRFDEIQDNEWSIRGLLGGAGLITGLPYPSLGPPNRGLSRDLDDLSLFIAVQESRPDTPFLNPDGSLTAEADSGRTLFHDPAVGCATCHSGPFYTDSSLLADPYIKHDVGTADSTDADAADGFDTPSLVAVWDSAPYLHHHYAKTLEAVLTTFNPDDQHGTTSQLSTEQIAFLVAFLQSIGWPDSLGTPVDAPRPTLAGGGRQFESVFPNPFSDRTSLRFRLERSPSRVRIEIFDVAGRRVRTLVNRTMARGVHIVGWDSRDAEGRPVAPGTYFARLLVDEQRVAAKKMSVLR